MLGPAGWELCRRAGRASLVACLGLSGLAASLTAARALTAAPVVPELRGALGVCLGLLPAALALALPVGVLVGVAAAARSWREGGELAGLASLGHPARRLVPALLLIGGMAGALEAGLTHGLEPLGLQAVRRGLAGAASSLSLRPGQPLALGGTLVRAAAVDDQGLREVFLASGDLVLTGARGRMEGGRLRLEDGAARSIDADGQTSWTLQFAVAQVPLAPPPQRVERTERSTPSLADLVRRIRAEGRDPRAEALALWRRTVLPASLPLLALLGFPLGARGVRPALAATATILGWWTLQRLSDQAAPWIGPALAALAPLLALSLATAAAWWTWRAR